MANKNSFLDYVNTASNVAQNIQLAEIGENLKSIRAFQKSIKQAEEDESNASELLRQCRNLLWSDMEQLEDLEKKKDAGLIGYDLPLFVMQSPFSADHFDDWEDKKRLKQYLDKLKSLKAEVRKRLGDQTAEDLQKVAKGIIIWSELLQFIQFVKLAEEYDRIIDPIDAEIERLENENETLTKSFFFEGTIREWLECRSKKRENESEIERLEQKKANIPPMFASLHPNRSHKPVKQDTEWHGIFDKWFQEKEDAGTIDTDSSEDEIELQLLMRCEELEKKFGYEDLEPALLHKTELLKSAQRLLKFKDLEEAEAFYINTAKALNM